MSIKTDPKLPRLALISAHINVSISPVSGKSFAVALKTLHLVDIISSNCQGEPGDRHLRDLHHRR